MNILIKPIVTEKMTAQGEDFNRYGFVVAKEANKLEIKKAVEELYNVKVSVESVNTMRLCRETQAALYKNSG
jgi:large subunit ribosomal protein L23